MTQRLSPSLTPLDIALAALLRGLDPVAPIEVPLVDALGCIASEMSAVAACPAHDVAAVDGWAMLANDLVGASSYSPLPLHKPPVWVEAGDVMPEGSDCVLDVDAVDTSGPITEVLAEGVPGQGVRRAGSDIARGATVAAAGCPVGAADLLLARAVGLEALRVRRPRLHIVNVPGATVTAGMIMESGRAAGAQVTMVEAKTRDATSIADVLDATTCDLLLLIGGSGVGRHDAAVTAMARRGEVLAHGIALQPGRTTALGRLDGVPVVALPGSPDQALAAWLALVLPTLDRLSARLTRKSLTLPLARKIASSVGLAEIALLAEENRLWLPLAAGELPLQAIVRADAWLLINGNGEGFAAGAPVDAYLMPE